MIGQSDRQAARQRVIEWLRGFNKKVTNRITMRFAGKRVYAVVYHPGRRSGKEYQTPVVAMPRDDGFIFPLPYGAHTDWCRNLMAAGEGRMQWHGRFYSLRDPRLIEPVEAVPAFPQWLHPLLRRTEVYLEMQGASPLQSPLRRVLVYGAGVLGSLYAGKLCQAGYDVTLLARGQRLAELRAHGLILVDDASGKREELAVPVTDRLGPDDAYDLVLVVVRKNQIASVLPALAENHGTPNVLFLVNNAAGPDVMVESLGRERVLLGFPGAGGKRSEGVVHYIFASAAQPTTMGELDGHESQRLHMIRQMFSDAGLAVAFCNNMDAWLKTHVALVSPIANALYMAGGDNYRLAKTRDGIVLLVRAVKEGLWVLRALGIPLTPSRYRVLALLPEPLLVSLLQKRLGHPMVELIAARHANAARDEMGTIAAEFRVLARQSGVATPAIDRLYAYIDPDVPPAPEGQAEIRLAWGPTIAATGALLSMGLLAAWLLRKKPRGQRHSCCK